MLSTRWRKVLLDLSTHKTRTLLVVLAITVGVFAVGFVANAQSILLRELDRGYQETAAASAVLFTQPFTEDMVDAIRAMPDVGAAEGRRRVSVKVPTAGGQRTEELLLTAVTDFSTMTLDRVVPVAGEWPPRRGTVLIERLSLDYLGIAIGDTIDVELPDGGVKRLTVAGVVHDANVPSATITNNGFGFITMDTLDALGLGDFYTELRIRVANDLLNQTHIETVATAVEDRLEKSSYPVASVEIPTPGEHWAQQIIETLVLLFTLFGFLILGLSGFLVVNTITALITQQIQQIGVMKLIGGRRRQITGMYLVMVVSYGLLSLLIGVPLSIFMAQWVVQFAADLLNVRIISVAVPLSVMGMQAAVGLLVPLAAALLPVINGVQITTHKALNNQGISSGSRSQRLTDQFMTRLQRLLPVQRPLIISFRNTVRKKARLVLTLATLILGTALFIAVLSVRVSVQSTIDDFLRYSQYDVSVNLERPYRQEQLAHAAGQVPGVTAVEGWLNGSVRRVYADGTTGDRVALTAAPANTGLMDPQLQAGRWLQPGDTMGVVINTDFQDADPDVQVGSELVLDIDGREVAWTVVGVSLGAANGAAVYVNYDDYARVARLTNLATSVKIVTLDHSVAGQEDAARRLTAQFESLGIDVASTRTIESVRQNTESLFDIIIGFLVLMAVLLAIVGGLGLTTTMSINVLERIREIGVLRAIGASDGAVRQIVLAEGILIGGLSWLVGSVLSIPASQLLSQQVGMAMLGFPLNYDFSESGMFLWLFLVLLLATAASLGPARNASRLTIREVLAYE